MPANSDATVLIVNDTPDQLDLMRAVLRQAGYRVLYAPDGLEGFDTALRERPHLIVSDVLMPRAGGIELCRMVRADPLLRLTPVLLVSAMRKDSASVLEGLGAGADGYLEAPYEPVRLIARATRLIERARAERALQESEERYKLLFESNPQPMWVFDQETFRFLAVNEAAVRSYGYSREEFLSMTIKDIRPAEDVPALLENVAQAARGLDQAGAWRHRKKDGTVLEVEITSHDIIFDGREAGLVLAADVTERRRLEEQILQSQKMEAVGRLAGGIAHDFNNLLTVITGYGDLLLKGQLDEQARRKAEEVRKAAERAAGLTRQLLAFSRKQILQPKVISLNDVVSDVDKMLRRLIGEDVELVTLLGRGLDKVKADPGQVEQVVMNLAVNARDAMPQGGKLTVETGNVYLDDAYARRHATVTPGRYVMLAVSDTGTGMDEETQRRVFEPFFTTKEVGKGTGLGLSTVYGIVKQSGGHIWVYSEPGHGTTFKVYLPAAGGAGESLPKEFSTERPRGTETILLVEDEEAVRLLLLNILGAEGYTVLPASNGPDALRLCGGREGPIHLLVTDVVMPGMSGRELAGRVTEECGGVKVLYMSGYTDDAVVRHGVLEEGAAFLQKPFTPEAVLRKVREVLDAPGHV
jgi:PAS domain S-box-containing protein